MSEDSEVTASHKSWLERLSHAFAREPKDLEQLMDVLREANQRDLIDDDSFAMIEGVLDVAAQRVRDIMIPRSQMIVIEHTAPLEEVVSILIDSEHSRYPVIGENRDEVVGILLAKDLLAYAFQNQESIFDVTRIMRTPVFVPESKRLGILLREFRQNHNHMALVVDEYGGIAGLVTIEDVLEEIVGDIEDEYDTDEEAFIRKQNEKSFIVKALTPIEEFNEYFNDDLSNEEFDTIGGLVMNKFGCLPKKSETIILGKYRFKVIHADSRRVRLFQVKLMDEHEYSSQN